MTKPQPPRHLHHEEDEWGPIDIYEDKYRRWLSFGNHTEQSSILTQYPDVLVYPYNQAMMLAMVFTPYPRQFCVLGLGGGSLVTTLFHRVPHAHIEAVELRPALLPLAKNYFALPKSQRIRLYSDDALHFLEHSDQHYDVILSDLYNAEGMAEEQIGSAFVSQCYDHLSLQGVLVLNVWEEETVATSDKLAEIEKQFPGRVLKLTVPGKNNTVFAFRDSLPRLNKTQLRQRVMQLDQVFRIPLRDFSESLWQAYDSVMNAPS